MEMKIRFRCDYCGRTIDLEGDSEDVIMARGKDLKECDRCGGWFTTTKEKEIKEEPNPCAACGVLKELNRIQAENEKLRQKISEYAKSEEVFKAFEHIEWVIHGGKEGLFFGIRKDKGNDPK